MWLPGAGHRNNLNAAYNTGNNHLLPINAYITAGGQSRRFGEDKARVLYKGEPLIRRVADNASAVCRSVCVVADKVDKYKDLNLRTIADNFPGLGPLAGLEAALTDHCSQANTASGEWILLLACDLLIVRPSWIEMLFNAASNPVQIVVFRNEKRYESLVGLYHVKLLKTVRERLRNNELSLQDLINNCENSALPLPADWPVYSQVNTKEELKKALQQDNPG